MALPALASMLPAIFGGGSAKVSNSYNAASAVTSNPNFSISVGGGVNADTSGSSSMPQSAAALVPNSSDYGLGTLGFGANLGNVPSTTVPIGQTPQTTSIFDSPLLLLALAGGGAFILFGGKK